MEYKNALEFAGATVYAFESFGSYQGDWWAKVSYFGKTGWVHGSFGSCSVCDALQSEFDCESHNHGENYFDPTWGSKDEFDKDCEQCKDFSRRFSEFGKGYLGEILTQEEAIANASENLEWDMGAQEMVDFIKNNPFEL